MSLQETRPLKIYATLLASASLASASTSSRLELLDHVRLHNIRVPKIIVEQGAFVLNSGSSIGDRRWDIMEQVVIAALDNGDDDVADKYIFPLRQQFPESQRVKRLTGMALEAKGDYSKVSVVLRNVHPSPAVQQFQQFTSSFCCTLMFLLFFFSDPNNVLTSFFPSPLFPPLHPRHLQFTTKCLKQTEPICWQ